MSSPRFQAGAVRPPAVAGTWYPGEPAVLSAQVEAMLRTATPWTRAGRLRAVVVPHAGLRYSGPTAACAYVAFAPHSHRRAVVLAPNHRVALMGAAVDPSSHYETPLGRMRVDLAAVEQLAGQQHFLCSPRPFAEEHAIEMQLPFLQHFLPQATLVPVLIGEVRGSDEFTALARSLATVVDTGTVLVVSSDFMHYGHAFGYVPFVERVAERIRDYDTQAIAALHEGSFENFAAVLERTGNTICGRRPLAVLLKLLPPTWRCELRDYTTSGAITGDWSHSVSYAALTYDEDEGPADGTEAHRRSATAAPSAPSPSGSDAVAPPASLAPLTPADKRRLLRLARRSIEHAAGLRGPIDTEAAEWSPALRTALAAFVSLHRREDGKLRGCIGWLEPHAALAEAVIENAASAAMRDPRFPPVDAGEVENLDIEVSVLGPMLDVDDVNDIQVGRDGLVLVHESVRGVLLPQVAVHMGWNRQQFLEAVCRKAGLPTDTWRRGAWIRRFEAEVFSESSLDLAQA